MKERIELLVYRANDLTTPLETIARRWSPTMLEEINRKGGGSFRIRAGDPLIVEQPDLLEEGKVIKVKVNGVPRLLWEIEKSNTVMVDEGEYAGRWIEFSGSSVFHWLSHAVVLPEKGLAQLSDDRNFNYAAQMGSWYKAAEWVNAVRQGSVLTGMPGWATPKSWPALLDADWIYDIPFTLAQPLGDVYYRREFSTAAEGKYRIVATVDDYAVILIDGVRVLAITEFYSHERTFTADVTLPAGNHVLAARSRQSMAGGEGNGASGLVLALCRLGEETQTETLGNADRVIWTGDDLTKWKVNGARDKAPGFTVGGILKTLIDEAKARGVDAIRRFGLSFTETVDSYGVAWPDTIDPSFSVGTSLAEVVTQLTDSYADVWMTPDMVLHAAPQRGRTVAQAEAMAEPVVFRRGHTVLQASTEATAEIANAAFVKTAGGMVESLAGQESLSKYGRRETYLSAVNASENGTAPYLIKQLFDKFAQPRRTPTLRVYPADGSIPFVDFNVGDFVGTPDEVHPDRHTLQRVVSISVDEDPDNGAVRYVCEFDTIQETLEERLARWLDQQGNEGKSGGVSGTSSSGSGADIPVPGTGSPAVPVPPDGRQPTVPGSVAITAKVAPDDRGYMVGSVAGSWVHDGKALDGTPMPPRVYEVYYKLEAETTYKILATTAEKSFSYSPLPVVNTAGAPLKYHMYVRAVGANGRPSEASTVLLVTMVKDTTPPVQPAPPVATAVRGVFTVAWSGKDKNGAGQVSDYSHSVAQRLTGTSTWVDVGRLAPNSGVTVANLPYGSQTFRVVSYDTSGNASVPSTSVTATTTPLVGESEFTSAVDDLARDIGDVETVAQNAAAAAQTAREEAAAADSRAVDAAGAAALAQSDADQAVRDAAAADAAAVQAAADAEAAETKAAQGVADALSASKAAAVAAASARAALLSSPDFVTDPDFTTKSDDMTSTYYFPETVPADPDLPHPAAGYALLSNYDAVTRERFPVETGRIYQVDVDICPPAGDIAPSQAFNAGVRVHYVSGLVNYLYARKPDADGNLVLSAALPSPVTGWSHYRGWVEVSGTDLEGMNPWLRNGGSSPGWMVTNWHVRDVTEAMLGIRDAAAAAKAAKVADDKAEAAEVSIETKANAAREAAILAAAADATEKAEAAEAAAALTAAVDAAQKAATAKQEAIGASAEDAQEKADAAKAAAVNAAALDATAKREAAEAAAATDASNKADAALIAAKIAALPSNFDRNGENKWLYTRVNTPTWNTYVPKLEDFLGTPSEQTHVPDDGDLIRSVGDQYRGWLRTNVYVAEARTVTFSGSHDDAGAIYVNGKVVYSHAASHSTPSPYNVPLPAGWSIVDLVWGEATGNDGWFSISPAIHTLVDDMVAPSTAAQAAKDVAQAVADSEAAKSDAADAQSRAAAAEIAADTAADDAAASLEQARASAGDAGAAQAAADAAQAAANLSAQHAEAAGTDAAAADAKAAQAAADAAQAIADAASAVERAGIAAENAAAAAAAAEVAGNVADAAAAAAQTADQKAAAAQQAAVDADGHAATAQSAAEAAQTRADEGVADALAAKNAAAAAQSDADAADAKAVAAQADADAADAKAAAAASSASAAQSAADEADRKALEAAGLAGGKGTVYVQAEPPADDPNSLWIDQSRGNLPRKLTTKRALLHSNRNADSRAVFTERGWTVDYSSTLPTLAQVLEYDLLIVDQQVWEIGGVQKDLARDAYAAGVSVITSGNDTNSMPGMFAGTIARPTPKADFPITPYGDHPVAQGWAPFEESDMAFGQNNVDPSATVVAVVEKADGTKIPMILVKEDLESTARWVHFQPAFQNSPADAEGAAIGWLASRWRIVQDQGVGEAAAAAAVADAAAAAAQQAADAAAGAAAVADGKAATAQSAAEAADQKAANAAAAADTADGKAAAARSAADAAGAAAAAAQADADQALTDANTAQLAADAAALAAVNAQQTADGKITVSTSAPNASDGVGKPVPALWQQKTSGKVVGNWEWTGSAWSPLPLAEVMIPQVAIGTGTYGELDGIRIKAQSIGVQSLVVSDFTNLWPNPYFLESMIEQYEIGEDYAGAAVPRIGAARLIGRRDHIAPYPFIPARNGDQFVVEADVHRESGNTHQLRGGVWQYRLDGQGTGAAYRWAAGTMVEPLANGWERWRWTASTSTASDLAYVKLYFQIEQNSSAPTDSFAIANVSMRKLGGGELIVDGGIKTRNLASESVEADKIKGGAVQAQHIGVGEVRQSAVTMGNDELIPNPVFSNTDLWDKGVFKLAGPGVLEAVGAGNKADGSNRSLYFNTSSTTASVAPLTDTLPIAEGDKLYLNMVAKSYGAGNKVLEMKVRFLSAGGNFLSSDGPSMNLASASTSWVAYEKVVTAPAGAIQMQIVVSVKSGTTGAGIIKQVSARRVLTSTTAEGQRVEISPQGVRMWGPGDEGLPSVDLTTTGQGTFTLHHPDTDEPVLVLDNEGRVSGRTVSATNSMLYRGTELGTWLDPVPRGPLYKAELAGNRINNVSTKYGLVEAQFTVQGDRQIGMRAGIQFYPNFSTETEVYAELRYTTDGSTPTINSPLLINVPLGRVAINVFDRKMFEHTVRPKTWIGVPDGTIVRVLLLVLKGDGNPFHVEPGVHTYLYVDDIGQGVPHTGNHANGGGVLSTGTPPPVQQPKITYVWEQPSNGFQTWYADGATKYTSGPNLGKAVQGYTSSWAAGGLHKAQIYFPDFLGSVAGSTIEKVEIYLYAEHWWSGAGGTLRLHFHSNLSAPATASGQSGLAADIPFGRAQGKWITVDPAHHAGFLSGAYRGVALDPRGSTSNQYYGLIIPGESRLKITHTK